MRTEELRRGGRGEAVRGVSPALEDRQPAHWLLTDAHGRPASLSAAGWVLHYRRTYRLWVAGDGPPPEVRLVTLPPFLKRQPCPDTAQRHGREYRCLSFRVQREWGWLSFFKWPYEIRIGDLEVECGPAGESRDLLICPVVARTRWSAGIVLLLMVGYLAGWLAQQGIDLGGECWRHGVREGWSNWWTIRTPGFWLWPVLFALLNPLACLAAHLHSLRQRSTELEKRFREQHLSE